MAGRGSQYGRHGGTHGSSSRHGRSSSQIQIPCGTPRDSYGRSAAQPQETYRRFSSQSTYDCDLDYSRTASRYTHSSQASCSSQSASRTQSASRSRTGTSAAPSASSYDPELARYSRASGSYSHKDHKRAGKGGGKRGGSKGSKRSKGSKGSKGSRRGSTVLLVAGIVLLVVALGMLAHYALEYISGDKQYDEYVQYGMSDEVADAILKGEPDVVLDIDWASLRAINPEIIGWIKVPGTKIDYPIAQHDDNEYYLEATFDYTEGRFGTIFLDYESSPTFNDYHSIIYGHNMLNGSMFATFADFVEEDYFREHQDFLLATPDGGTWHLKAVSVVVAEGDEKLRQTYFSSRAEFESYVQSALDRCDFSESVDISKVNHLYTFATCSYQFDDARTLVFAIEVDKDGNQVTRETLESQSATDNYLVADTSYTGTDVQAETDSLLVDSSSYTEDTGADSTDAGETTWE